MLCRRGFPILYKFMHNVLYDEHLGDDIGDGIKMCPTVFAIQLIRFSHKDAHTHTQQVGLLTLQHDDYLLLIKWKWTIIKVCLLLIFTLSRLKVAEVERWKGSQERLAHLM